MSVDPATGAGRCGTCWWDGGLWDHRDTRNVLRRLGTLWRWTTEGLDPAVVDLDPPPPDWSVTRHTDQVVAALTALRAQLGGVALGGPASGPPTEPIEAGSENHIEALARSLFDLARTCGDDQAVWNRLRHGLHVALHHQYLLGRTLRAVGAGAGHQEGTVDAVFVSDGGVPKRAVGEAQIGPRGLSGDRQAARQHHGRPSQAVCLWSAEIVASLAAAGHPLVAGAAGENLSVSGLAWATLRPGTLVQVGEARLVLTGYAEPCHKTAPCFLGGDARVMDHDHHPGGARAYAGVSVPGRVATGDRVVVEP